MAQFDVFRLGDGELVLDVQTDLLGDFDSRIVVPLMLPDRAPPRNKRLNPQLAIEGTSYVMVTQFIITVEARALRSPIDNLDRYCDEIKSAYDMIFNGL